MDLKVLIVAELKTTNRFIDLLVQSLSEKVKVTSSVFSFFAKEEHFDIVHIHWPEAFNDWSSLSEKKYREILEALDFWKRNSIIVYTKHNDKPHEIEQGRLNQIYNYVIKSSSGIIHLNEFELEDSVSEYTGKMRKVIRHGLYDYPNNLTKSEARKKLNLPLEGEVLLAFGKIRNEKEKMMILKAFRSWRQPQKVLLAPRWKHATYPSFLQHPWARLKTQLRDFFLSRFKARYRVMGGTIADDEIQFYMNAADVLIVPRVDALNSGVVFLGITFGKVIIGVNNRGIGELLNELKNPTFETNNVESVRVAIEQGIKLSKEGVGALNRDFGTKHLSWKTISDDHVSFYLQLTKA